MFGKKKEQFIESKESKESELIEMLLLRVAALEGRFNNHSHVNEGSFKRGEPSGQPILVIKEGNDIP